MACRRRHRNGRIETLGARYEGLPPRVRERVCRGLAGKLREWTRYKTRRPAFSLFPWLRFAPAVLPAVPVVGVVDPAVVGVWTAVGAFAGCVLGTIAMVTVAERRE